MTACIAAAVTAAAAGAYAVWPSTAAADEPMPSEVSRASELTVTVAAAERVESFERSRIYTGTLVAARRSTLSFEVAGKVIAVEVDEGDRVEAGQPLARLDTRRIEARLARADAELKESRARLAELEFGPRVETIAAAEAEVRNVAAQRDVAERDLERRLQLVETRAVSREEYDQALFDYRAAEARLEVAQKTLDELLAGTRVEQVDAQAARVAALEAEVADNRHRLEDATLRAPYGGRIAVRRRDEGSVVSAGEPVFELIEDTRLEAWIGLPPRAARTLGIGEPITLSVDGRDFAAAVRSVRAELDGQTRTRNAVFALSDSTGLVAGQVVRVGVRQRVEEAGFWAPNAALQPRERGLWAVYVVDESGVTATRDVELLEVDGQRAFIRGTLQSGERMVVEGAHRVVAGQRVRAVEADPARDTVATAETVR